MKSFYILLSITMYACGIALILMGGYVLVVQPPTGNDVSPIAMGWAFILIGLIGCHTGYGFQRIMRRDCT